jgi:hypothetical protein
LFNRALRLRRHYVLFSALHRNPPSNFVLSFAV